MWKQIKSWFEPTIVHEHREVQKLGAIRAHLYELETKGVEIERCAKALASFAALEEHRTDLLALIPDKLEPGELLRDRLEGIVNKTFANAMTRLQRIARMIDRVSKVDDAEKSKLTGLVDEALLQTTADIKGMGDLWQELMQLGSDQPSTSKEVDHLVEILRRASMRRPN